jgi:predicted XRE-type DNA-binding protein
MGRPRKNVAAVGREEVLANPEKAGIRAQLCHELNELLDQRKITQTAAAELMGVHQTAVSNLRGYHVDKFSVERLLRLIVSLGPDVVIEIHPRAEKEGAGRVRVVGAA